MCMVYKGISYRYAFNFKVPSEGGVDNEFHIVIGDHQEEAECFSGLCLENGLIEYSYEKLPFIAFFEIINKIITNTLQSEKDYFETNSVQIPTQIMKVEDPEFLKKFMEYKENKKSLEYYEKLRDYLEKPETISEKLPDKIKLDLCDCPNLLFFSGLMNSKASLPIKDLNFFRV